MAFFIFIIALALFALLAPIAIAFKLVKALFTWQLDLSWFLRLALSLDQAGNVAADDLFNCLLIHNKCHAPFGDEDETISSVIGKNYLANNLTVFGRYLRVLLHKLDSNHSVDAIES